MPAFGPCRRACGCAGLFFCRRTPLSCLSSSHRSLPRLSFRLPSFFPSSVFLLPARISLCPHFPLPVFLSARVSLCPFLPLSVFLSARISPALSGRPPSSVFRLVFLLSFLVFPFIVHRSPLVVRRPLRRPSFIARRLLSVARCAVHRPALAACCPSLVAPFIVHRPPLVVRRPLRRPSSSACRLLSVARCPSLAARCLLSVVHCPSFAARCLSPVASPVPRRRAAPLSAALRSGSRLLYPRNPGLRVCGSCLPCRSAAGSVGRSFRKNASALRTLVAAPFLTK